MREYHSRAVTTAGLDIPTAITATKIVNSIERPKGYTVSYHANPEAEDHHFGQNHPMKPWRLTLTNKLVMSYGMHDAMDMYLSRPATEQELNTFHTENYVKELQRHVIFYLTKNTLHFGSVTLRGNHVPSEDRICFLRVGEGLRLPRLEKSIRGLCLCIHDILSIKKICS